MAVRDEAGEVFADAELAEAFGVRGAPATSPGRLALVTALQFVEGRTDRQAAQMVVRAIDWKYALGLELTGPGFDYTVLSRFRARVVEHGLEEKALDLLLAALKGKGLVGAGGRQRTGSTHVVSAIRDVNRLELAGESVRACVEAPVVAAPGWLTRVIDVPGWNQRYGARVGSWRLPASETKRAELAAAYGGDALALLRAVYAPGAPPWLRELPAVGVLRVVLVQNYTVTTGADGTEVVKRREADTDGLPPARARLASPHDIDMTSTRGGRPTAATCSGTATRSTSPRPATTPPPRPPPRPPAGRSGRTWSRT
jgi:transposase